MPVARHIPAPGSAKQGNAATPLTAAELAAAIRASLAVAKRLLPVVTTVVEEYAPDAPDPLKKEAAIRFAGYLAEARSGAVRSRRVDVLETEHVTNHAPMFRNSGAAALLTRYRIRRGGAI